MLASVVCPHPGGRVKIEERRVDGLHEVHSRSNISGVDMTRRLQRLVVVTLALAIFAVVPAGVGAAANKGPVSLKTKQGYANRSASFCGKHRRINLFHRNSVIEFKGLLTPPTGRHFPVKIEIKRCAHRRFVSTGAKYHATGKKSGKFKVFHKAPGLRGGRHAKANYFYARAIVNGQRSAKTYFAVTR